MAIVDPEIVIPFEVDPPPGVLPVGSESSELTQEVKNATPKLLNTVASPAFSIKSLLDTERFPERRPS